MCLPRILCGVVILLVDLDLIRQFRDVRNIDLHRAVAQRFHELVVLELAIFGLVGVADDDFVDIGLREFLRLDLVFLAGAEQIVQERDLELQDFDELDDAAVGDVELAVEVERASVGVRTVDGDLAIVDVAREFGRILVLFVFRLERADTDTVFFRKHQAANLDVIHDLEPVAFVAARQLTIHLAARRAEIAFDLDRITSGRVLLRMSSSISLPRWSAGIRWSGSSRIGQGSSSLTSAKTSFSTSFAMFVHANVYMAPSGVREYSSSPFLSRRTIVLFALPTGPCSKNDATFGSVVP